MKTSLKQTDLLNVNTNTSTYIQMPLEWFTTITHQLNELIENQHTTPSTETEYFTSKEVMQLTNTCWNTLNKRIADGTIKKSIVRNGRKYLFKKELFLQEWENR